MPRIRQYKRYPTIDDIDRYAERRGITFQLITDSQDVSAVFDSIGYHPRNIDGLFVSVGNAEYDQIFGFVGCVPFTYKPIYRIL